jgi:type I restriction enzyme S subunit
MSFPRYPRYKDSGVEWLGEVPEHWNPVPIKHLGKLKGGAGFPHDEQGLEGEELPFHKVNALARAVEGVIHSSQNTISRGTAERLGAYVFPPGTIVFAKVGAALLLGRLCRLSTDACIDNNMMGLVVDESGFDLRYVQSAMSMVRFDLIANPGAVPSLNEAQIGDFRLALPPLEEQRLIAHFLNRETAKIDALIAEQQRLIELLREKRQAVISHAVTCGLDPDAPLKPSGVEWLGDVPAHFEVQRVKSVSDFTTSGPRGWSERLGEEGAIFIQSGDLDDCLRIKFGSAKRVRVEDSAEAARTRLLAGDVVVCITGAKTGNVAVCDAIPEEAYVNQHLCLIRPTKDVNPEFLGYLLKSDIGQTHFSLSQYGLKQGLSLEDVRDAPVVLPPVAEQIMILAQIESHLAETDALITTAERAITLLQERRTALISAAVTGKIDVRGLAEADAE